jgi:peptidoglycan DL-endopeptidase RipB
MRPKPSRRLRLAWLVLAVMPLLLVLAVPASADPDSGQWDPTLPKLISSGAPGDPVAIANASLAMSAQATQTTLDLGRKFLGGLGFNIGGSDADTAPSRIPRVYGRQAIEYVIRRGASQIGVPYSWGGGTPNGPSVGVGDDAGTVGYDCSGFTRFAFAGVGVLIPKYSGDQYNTGRHIPPSQAERGDLIFYGPGGSQHVTIYMGNGQMLEASSAAGEVTVSPVRMAGMSPYLARIIES